MSNKINFTFKDRFGSINKTSLYIVLLSVLLFLSERFKITNISRDIRSSSLLWYKTNCIRLARFIKEDCNIFSAFQENRDLKSKLLSIERELLVVKRSLSEIQVSKNLVCKKNDTDKVEKVYGFSGNYYNSYMYISAAQEYKQCATVYDKNGLVGIVLQMAGGRAIVKTILDRNFYVPVMTKNNVHLILRGDSKMMVSYLVQDNISSIKDEFKIGDLLVTSGEKGFFGKGIHVARVVEVNNYGIKAEPVVKLDAINYVYVSED